jgi:hypothetical protein
MLKFKFSEFISIDNWPLHPAAEYEKKNVKKRNSRLKKRGKWKVILEK